MIKAEPHDTSKRKVRFEESQPQPPRPEVPYITNFCTVLKKSQASACMGCLQEGDKCYIVYPIASEDAVSAPEEGKSLATILRTGAPGDFALVDRLVLSFTLASSVLRLYSTPWLRNDWSKQDIVFFRNGSQSAPFTWEEPYLSLDLWTKSEDAAMQLVTTDSAQASLSAGERLAIILLELGYNTPLEDSPSYQSLLPWFGGANPLLYRLAANMWVKKVDRHTSKMFADTVNWCLTESSSTTRMRMQDWIKAFHKNVVAPLKQCCKSLTDTYSMDSADVEGGDSSTNFHIEVSKGGVYIAGPPTFTGSQKIGT